MGDKGKKKVFGNLNTEIVSQILEQSFQDIKIESFRVKEFHAGTNLSLLLELEYDKGIGPHSVFVKVSDKLSSRLALRSLGALYTESLLAKEKTSLPFRHPHLYGGMCNRRKFYAVLAEEDISGFGKCHTPLETLNLEEVKSGLDELAKLHASQWGLRQEESFLRPWKLKEPFATVSIFNLMRAFKKLENTGHALTITKHLRPLTLSREFQESSLLYREGVQTLLHGDPHIGNTYTVAQSDLGFLDLQLMRYGNWSFDVGYFLLSSLSSQSRQDNLEELVRYYLDRLTILSIEAPNFQKAFCLIRYTPAFGLVSWLHTLAFRVFQKEEYCLEMISRFFSAYEDLDTNELFTQRISK